MKPALVSFLLALAVVAVPTPARANDDPLVCVDPGAIHVHDVTVDPPKVCVL